MRIRPPSPARKAVKGVYIYIWEAAADAAAGNPYLGHVGAAKCTLNLLKINLLKSKKMRILYMD